tara:strand:- start:398 stop:745 length:348 start_codon:yes stop_codon:yes gene_type:complete
MQNLNQWIGEGNISQKPTLRHTNDSNRPVCNFHIYVDNIYRSKKNADGEILYKKRTSKIPVVAWATKAETVARDFNKGDKVRIVGRIKTRVIERENTKISTFEIVLENISLINKA